MNTSFNELIMRYAQEREASGRDAIEQQLWDQFGTKRAVFILDMSGFSVIVARHGVVHYLSMVRRMQLTAKPLIESYGGTVVKFEADNCFATFPEPLNAIQASIALNQSFAAANLVTQASSDIHISCGIDYGAILMIDDRDMFGHAVNRASKLGEDIANAGQILVTKEARDLVSADVGLHFEPHTFQISAIEIEAFDVSLATQR